MMYERKRAATTGVAITGIGLCTPLGSSFWSSAAAALAKRTRWQEHEMVLVPDDDTGMILRGATVSRIPRKLLSHLVDGDARAEALLEPAMQELLASASTADVRYPSQTVRSFVCMAETDAAHQTESPDSGYNQTMKRPAEGRGLFFEDLMQAAERLRYGKTRWEVVGCVDSLCSVSKLRKLMMQGKLLSGTNPEGIVAGEAAGVFLLENEEQARQRNAPVYARISGFGTAQERGATPGEGLTEAFRAALASLPDMTVSAVIADLNGERHRALDWAYAQGRVFADTATGPDLLHPADVVGDCGGVMGAVVLAAGILRLAFHPAAKAVAAYTSDDDGSRRVICLERGDLKHDSIVRHLRPHQGA